MEKIAIFVFFFFFSLSWTINERDTSKRLLSLQMHQEHQYSRLTCEMRVFFTALSSAMKTPGKPLSQYNKRPGKLDWLTADFNLRLLENKRKNQCFSLKREAYSWCRYHGNTYSLNRYFIFVTLEYDTVFPHSTLHVMNVNIKINIGRYYNYSAKPISGK